MYCPWVICETQLQLRHFPGPAWIIGIPASLMRMDPILVPSIEKIESIIPPLMEGERELVGYLSNALRNSSAPSPWEIYIQPKLNGGEPDIITFNEHVGFTIYEVKDYSPESYKRSGEHLCLMKDASTLIDEPWDQANWYRESILKLLCPALGELLDGQSGGLACFQIRVYAHRMKTCEARSLFSTSRSRNIEIFGFDKLQEPPSVDTVPGIHIAQSSFVGQDPWRSAMGHLRGWLQVPVHVREKADPLPLTKAQRKFTMPAPGWHRLRGPVGCGKTDILAQRAAYIAASGLRVLVVCYNITLFHYIRDRVARAQRDTPGEGSVVYYHFHGFCSSELFRLGLEWGDVHEGTFDSGVVQRILHALKSGNSRGKKPVYDAVLIDEAQDFQQSWVEFLAEYLSQRNELLIVADRRQNLYRRDLAWTEKPFRRMPFEDWIDLPETCRRMHPELVTWINEFFPVPADITRPLPAQGEFSFAELRWTPCLTGQEPAAVARAVDWLLDSGSASHPSDICILVFTHSLGWRIVEAYEKKGQSLNHVLRREKGETARKRAFWMGDGRMKLCTVHSFKGWEIPAIVLVASRQPDAEDLAFVGISRSKHHVVLIDTCSLFGELTDPWKRLE